MLWLKVEIEEFRNGKQLLPLVLNSCDIVILRQLQPLTLLTLLKMRFKF